MAKIKYSALVSDMRNKLNGSVLSKNKYGSYVRNKVTPVNPQTSYQLAQRANLSSLSSQWRGLTDEQRGAWSAAALDAPFTDIFGDTKTLTGQALYVSRNLNLLAASSAQVLVPGSQVAIPTVIINDFAVEVGVGGTITTAEVTVNLATIPVGFKAVCYATPAYSPGVSFVKNKYRNIGVFIATAGVVDIAAALTDRFGSYQAGDKVSVRVALVSTTTGQLGLASSFETIVG